MRPLYEIRSCAVYCHTSSQLVFPAHLHESMEFIYVHNGHHVVTINNQSFTLSEGELGIVFPNIIHSYEGCKEPVNSNEENISILICSLKHCGDFFNTIVKSSPEVPFLHSNQVHPNIPYALKEIEKEQALAHFDKVYQSLIQLILSRALPYLQLKNTTNKESYDLAGRIVCYVAENFQEPITLDSLALNLNVSKYHLSHVFSNKMHTNFNHYLNDIRLNYAAMLIASTDLTLTEIWTQSGFESQRTFNRVFKEVYSMTPKEYRFYKTPL